MWVYMKTEEHIWTVGFYDPSGYFHPESAVKRANYLNGRYKK